VARGLRLGRAAIEAGAGSLLDRLVAGKLSEPPGLRAGQAVVKALLELRGAALKIAQFLSLESDLLPEPLIRQLSQTWHRVPPMSPAFARARVEAEIGPIDRRFSHFDPTPFAAASLGQVHAAKTRDGRDVVMKVQYPGMAEAVSGDIRLLRRAFTLLPHCAHYHHLLDEIECRLLEECDYGLEAEALDWFRGRLAVRGVSVAEVVASLSARQVLCTARLPGLHVDAWLARTPSQDMRDKAGQQLYDVFVQSLHVLGRLHADPNPGNLLFGARGELALLDFGCTRWIAPDCQDLVTRIWRAAVTGDDVATRAVYGDMGLFAHLSTAQARQLDARTLRPFMEWLAQPFRPQRFDFGVAPGFVAEGRRLFTAMLRDEALVGIRPEFVLIHRTLYGLYRLFEQLGARIRCRTAWTSG
jgi:predicted unusual protein kinase regulating ubiquinone biosynthesis (AarF/ABC1/UbiB family)